MLIDDSSKIARLSSCIAGMDHIQPIYHYIWKAVNNLKDRLITHRDKIYLLNDNIVNEDGKY